MRKCCPKLPIAFILVFILGAFFYYQYSFTAVSKINFKEDIFYFYENGGVSLFTPKDSEYQLCFYNSFVSESKEFLENRINATGKILAIDFYQQSKGDFVGNLGENFIEVRIPSSLMLKLIHNFNLKTLPNCFMIKKSNENPAEYEHLKEVGIYKIINFQEKENKEK